MPESEKVLEAKLRERLRALGGLALKLPAIHHAGLPDRLCLLPEGFAFFVEVKSTGEKPRPLQAVCHATLRRMGFEVYVIDTTEGLNEVLSKYTPPC